MNKTVQEKTFLKQLNFKVSEDFYWKLKNLASTKRIKMSEVLEQAFEFYKQREKTTQKANTYQQTIQTIERQMQPFQGKITWTELESGLNNLNPIYFNKIGLVITYRILRGSLEECLRLWKGSIQ